MKKALLSILAISALYSAGPSMAIAGEVPDRIMAIVGNEVVLKSEVDERELMIHSQYPDTRKDPQLRQRLFDNLVDQKILLTKAKLDSVKVDESAIDASTTERFAAVRSGFPTLASMEARFGKPASRLKQDIRNDIREQQLVDNLRRSHARDVKVTYDEAIAYYNREQATLPLVPEQVSASQIIRFPLETASAKAAAFARISDVQARLKAGGSFASVASAMSDDPGSRQLGGDLGFVQKGELVPQFEAAAYALKAGQISAPVETRFGYHIIQLLSREDNRIHVRHILAAFDRSQRDYAGAIEQLMAARADILAGKANFAAMAEKYSDDPMSSRVGGLIRSGATGDTLFELSSLRPELQQIIARLRQPGEISIPEQITPQRGEPFIAMFMLNSRVDAHRLSPEQDFSKLEVMATEEKRRKEFDAWMSQLRKEVFVKVFPE